MKHHPQSLLDQTLLKVNLRQAIFALAEALNLVGIDEQQHGERVAYMATVCANKLNWSHQAIDDLFHAGLLHDCGVSSTVTHKKLIEEMDWEGAELHCILGEYYLKEFPPLAYLAPVIRYHHTHWRQLQHQDLPEKVKLSSNLLYLVDRVDALRATLGNSPTISHHAVAETIRLRITQASGDHFAPQLVEVFLAASKNDAFWLTLEPLHLSDFMATMQEGNATQLSHYDEIRRLACIFAHIVDAKSAFTYDHSIGVSKVARKLAELSGLPQPRTREVELAGLLHDLGKLGVPDEILEKQGPLTAEEADIMHRHSYESFRILNRIKGFERIARWAGNHHETLLGDGYPFQYEDHELGIEARIIAVADIFQALAQDRPYRKALQADEVIGQLKSMAGMGKIDGDIVRLAEQHVDSLWKEATHKEENWLPFALLN